jgi:hypothetical protein
MIVTEAEIPAGIHDDLNVEWYTAFLPHSSTLLKTAKYRVVAMVQSALATYANAKLRPNLMHASVQSVWVQLDIRRNVLKVLRDLKILLDLRVVDPDREW